jgi:hypothetical protein
MNDQAKIQIALAQAALIVADHLDPELAPDPLATIKRLIEVLDNPELAAAIKRTERGHGLKVVK